MTSNTALAKVWNEGLRAGLAASEDAVPVNPYDRPDGFDPLVGDRIRPAWLAAAAVLRSGSWHSRIALADTMMLESSIVKNTATNVLRNAVNAGWLEQRGKHPNIEVRVTEIGVSEREELRESAQP